VVVGLLEVLTLALAIDVFAMGQAGPGVLAAAIGVGVFLGAGASGLLVDRRRLAPTIGAGILITGLPLAAIVLADHQVLAVVLLGLSGAGYSLVDVAGRTLYHRAVPYRLMSQVFGLQEGLALGANALGNALAPLLIVLFGPKGAVLATGLLLPLAGAPAWLLIRRVDASTVPPGPGLDLLREIPMFRVLEQPTLESLTSQLQPAAFAAGQSVIEQGEDGDCFFVIKQGRVTVVRDSVEMTELEPGDYFGETALLRDLPRNATVTALTDLELLTLSREHFLAAVSTTPLSGIEADEIVSFRGPSGSPSP